MKKERKPTQEQMVEDLNARIDIHELLLEASERSLAIRMRMLEQQITDLRRRVESLEDSQA